jgi:putative membrane protein
MKQHLIAGTIAMAVGIWMSLAVFSTAAEEGAKADHSKKHFMQEAAQGGLAEVALGKLAANQGENEEVKKFGQRMVTDHGKANEELKNLAASEAVTLPAKMDEEATELQQRLSKLSGAQFDRAYMKEMLEDHKKDIAAFERQSEQGDDPDVKKWAAQTLPTLKEHLRLAQETAKKVGVEASAQEEKANLKEAM